MFLEAWAVQGFFMRPLHFLSFHTPHPHGIRFWLQGSGLQFSFFGREKITRAGALSLFCEVDFLATVKFHGPLLRILTHTKHTMFRITTEANGTKIS